MMKSGGDYKKSDLLKKGCMNMIQLKTKWADNINEKNVLGEYPRPLMRRKSYVNLNGVWKYAIKDTKRISKENERRHIGPVFTGGSTVGSRKTVKAG